MTYDPGINSLGYQNVRRLPDTRPTAEKAADLLAKSVGTNVTDTSERQITALQGIGFALLALTEKALETPPIAQRPRRSRIRQLFSLGPRNDLP